MHPKREDVNFEVSHAEMLGEARAFAAEYPNYQEHFEMLDNETFHEMFLVELDNSISVAEAVPSDNVLIDEQAEEGDDVNLKMGECLDEVHFTSYYVKKIANGSKAVVDQFGYNDLRDIRRSPDRMVLFMDDFTQKVAEYNEELLAKRYPADRLSFLMELTGELKVERAEHRAAKNRRKRMTDTRTRMMNRVWARMVLLDDAVEFALPNDAVAQEIFSLPRPQVSSAE